MVSYQLDTRSAGGTVVKDPPAKAGDTGEVGSIPGSGKSPGGGNENPFQDPCLKKSHTQRSLTGYSPRSRKESDTTEHLLFTSLLTHTHTHTHTSLRGYIL